MESFQKKNSNKNREAMHGWQIWRGMASGAAFDKKAEIKNNCENFQVGRARSADMKIRSRIFSGARPNFSKKKLFCFFPERCYALCFLISSWELFVVTFRQSGEAAHIVSINCTPVISDWIATRCFRVVAKFTRFKHYFPINLI